MNTLVMAKNKKDRGVVNVPEAVRDAFSAYCNGRGFKVQNIAGQLLTWFLFQEEPVQIFVTRGVKAYTDETRDVNVKSAADMIIRQAANVPDVEEAFGKGEGDGIAAAAAEVVDPVVEQIADEKPAANAKRGRRTRRK